MKKALSLLLLLLVTVTGQAQEINTLTIAFIGSESAADQALYQAAVLAAQEINDLGGDDELRDPDDNLYQLDIQFYRAGNRSETIEAYEDAVADDALAVLMSSDSENLNALADDAAVTIPVFHAAANGISGNGFYRLVATYETQANAAADYLVNERRFTQIAFAGADTSSAQDVQDSFTAAVAANGGEMAFSSTHAADADDLQADAEDIRQSGAQALLLWTLDRQAVELLAALRNEGWDGVVIYNNPGTSFIERAGDLAQGVLSPAAWIVSAYDSQSQTFSRDFAAAQDSEAAPLAAAYYDAVYLLAEAVRQGGENAADELNTLGEYDGVQAVYNNTQAEDLLLIQYRGTTFSEAARYTDGVCVTCLDTWRAEQDSEGITSRDSLLIALLVPDNGPSEAVGIAVENAVELAVSEINDLGGVISDEIQYTLVLRTYRANNSQEAVAALQQAKQDGAVVVMGLDNNAQVLDNLGVIQQLALPLLVSATDSRIPVLERSNSVVQISTNDAAVTEAVVTYLISEREMETISIVAARTGYAREATAAAEDAIAASEDGRLELSLKYDLTEGDFAALAAQIVASDTESLLVLAPSADAAALLDALEAAGYAGIFVYPYLTAETVADFQSDSAEVLAAVSWWQSASDWASTTFTASYVENYGETPLPQTVGYYDAAYWVAEGIEAVGTDPAELANWLLETERFAGVQGVYAPAEYGVGEAIRSVMIGRVTGDGLAESVRYDGTICLIGCN